MATSPFTKYLEIVGVVEDQVTPPKYMHHVQVVEVVDQTWEPWEPVPGPDPWDDLVPATKTNTSGSTTLGSTLTGTLATYTGGHEPVTIEYQWQRSDSSSGGWSGITAWTTQTDSTPSTQTYTTVLADNQKFVRLASKATDADGVVAYGSGNSVGPMEAATITVSQATKISNGTYVNPPYVYGFETISVVPATFAGGFGTLTQEYRLQKKEPGSESWANLTGWSSSPSSASVSGIPVGSVVRAQSRATDETGAMKTSTSPTPAVSSPTTIGTLTITPDAPTADAGGEVAFAASISGTSTNPMYIWNVTGSGNITSSSNIGSELVVTVNSGATSGDTVSVNCTASDSSSSDSPVTTTATITVN